MDLCSRFHGNPSLEKCCCYYYRTSKVFNDPGLEPPHRPEWFSLDYLSFQWSKSLCLWNAHFHRSPENQRLVSKSLPQGPAACRRMRCLQPSPVCRPSAPISAGRPSAEKRLFQAHRPAAGPQYLSLLRVKEHDDVHQIKFTVSYNVQRNRSQHLTLHKY